MSGVPPPPLGSVWCHTFVDGTIGGRVMLVVSVDERGYSVDVIDLEEGQPYQGHMGSFVPNNNNYKRLV